MNSADDHLLHVASSQICEEAECIRQLGHSLSEGLVDIARRVATCTGRIHVSGVGTSRSAALRMAHLLCCGGISSGMLDPEDCFHGGLGGLRSDDLLLAISWGGETDSMCLLSEHCSRIGIPVVVITSRPDSTICMHASCVYAVQLECVPDVFQSVALGSSMIVNALTSGVCRMVYEIKGLSVESFAKTHPGGRVGALLLNRITKGVPK